MVAKRFEPELGEIVNSLIVNSFQTSWMFVHRRDGRKLDKVEISKEQWQKVIDEFFKPFQKNWKKLKVLKKIKLGWACWFDCDLCGHPMVIKLSRYSKFYACSNFPDCLSRPLQKKLALLVQPVGSKVKSSNVDKTKSCLLWICDRYPDCGYVVGYPCWT